MTDGRSGYGFFYGCGNPETDPPVYTSTILARDLVEPFGRKYQQIPFCCAQF